MFKFTVLRLLENSFVTPLFPSVHDLIITFSMYKNTPINVPKIFVHLSVMKMFFLKKVSHTEGERHYDLAPVENHLGVCAPSIFAKKWIEIC